jgi:hypothetical protein
MRSGSRFAGVRDMRWLVSLILMMLSGSAAARPHVLVVTATAGYRHESIPTAESTLQFLADQQDVEISFVRTPEEVQSRLTSAGLEGISAVFFVNTTGDLPVSAAQAVVEWVRDGGTFAGIHSASDTWLGVPEYVEMLGGEFIGHPPETSALVIVDDGEHEATRMLESPHVLFEEFYYLDKVDVTKIRMLLSIRRRPEPPADAGYWPLAWAKAFGRGRVVYSALGHREDVWLSEWFRAHVSGILRWAVTPGQAKRRSVRH